jgi:photosystem II stability/assembly factor-like uncharacterized protein
MRYLYLLLALCATQSLSAQIMFESASSAPADDPDWSVLMQDPSLNFYDVQALFESRWEGREITKGSGWKPFKRWEALMATRIDENGNWLSGEEIQRRYEDVLNIQAQRSPSGNWMPLGPILDENTDRDNISGVGRVNFVAFHPTDPLTIFCGAPAGGLWRTYDGGQNWVSNTDVLPTLGVSAIVFNQADPSIVYIGTGDRDAGDAPGMGVMKSIDGGLTWEFANDGMESLSVGDLLIDPINPEVLIAGTADGIFRSEDGAVTWELTSSNTINYKELAFKPGDSQIVYATGQGRFYKSVDNGLNWDYVNNGIQQGTRMVIAVTPANPEYVYVCSANSTDFRALFRSTDSGESFEEMSDSPNILSWAADGNGEGGQAWYDLCISADPVNADRIYVGGIRVKRSDDGGATWIDVQNSYLHVDQHWMEFSPHNGQMYLCNDGGIYLYENNTDWVDITNGIVNSQIYKFGQSQFNASKALCGFQDNGTSEYNGTNWQRINGGDGFESAYDPEDPEYWYTSLYYGQFYRTGPDYTNEKICGFEVLNIDESGGWLSPYFISEHNSNTMFAGLKNVWRTHNIKTAIKDSIVWERISWDLGGNNNSNLNTLDQSPLDSNLVYTSEGSRKFFRTNNALAPMDEVVWEDLSNVLPWVSVPVTACEPHPFDTSIVYLGFDKRVWKSENQGDDWVDISGTLPSVNINSIVFDNNSEEGLYISTDMGVYFKDAGMDDWISFSTGFPLGVRATELEIYYGETVADSRIRCSTYGRGLWESDLFDAETYLFPAIASLNTDLGTEEVFGSFDAEISFYRNLQNVEVTAFEAADLEVVNANVLDFAGGPVNFTVTFEPIAFGEVDISVPQGAATDDNGLETSASQTLQVVYNPAPEPFGYRGPGGVGRLEELGVWLRAGINSFQDMGTTPAVADGDKIQLWGDMSSATVEVSQESTDDRPTLVLGENGMNGMPAVEFNGENEYLIGNDVVPGVSTSVFSVAQGAELEWNDHGWIASARAANGFLLHPWKNSSLFSAAIMDQDENYANAPSFWIVDASQPQIYGVIYERWSVGQYFSTLNNDQRLPFNNSNIGERAEGASVDVRYGWDYEERFGAGKIGEHFVYNRRVFESHRTLITNYLAGKFGIDPGPLQRYGWEEYPHEIAGIGQETEYDFHADAQGSGPVRVSNPAEMEDGDYLMWGHDNLPMSFVADAFPIYTERLERTWGYKETGENGDVLFRIDLEGLDLPDGELGLITQEGWAFIPGITPNFIPLTFDGEYWSATYDFLGSGVFTIGVQPAVSVPDLSKADLAVYPNPAESNVTIRLKDADFNGVNVQLINSLGQLVASRPMNMPQLQLDLTGLAQGLYSLVLTKDDQRISTPLMVK